MNLSSKTVLCNVQLVTILVRFNTQGCIIFFGRAEPTVNIMNFRNREGCGGVAAGEGDRHPIPAQAKSSEHISVSGRSGRVKTSSCQKIRLWRRRPKLHSGCTMRNEPWQTSCTESSEALQENVSDENFKAPLKGTGETHNASQRSSENTHFRSPLRTSHCGPTRPPEEIKKKEESPSRDRVPEAPDSVVPGDLSIY